jgi:hypothetical protein
VANGSKDVEGLDAIVVVIRLALHAKLYDTVVQICAAVCSLKEK